MNAKKIKVLDNKKGWIEIGTLSKNELCRGVKSLMDEGQKLALERDAIGMIYQNHMLSIAILTPEERAKYFD
jgi:hypothetical protein